MVRDRKNKNIAMLFQGISANYKESFLALTPEQQDEIKRYCQIVREKYSYDLWAYICNKDFYTEEHPEMDWMAIYVANYVSYQSYIDAGFIPNMSVGYSLGLITAVACHDAISFEDGLDVFAAIRRYKETHAKQKENMAIIIGKTEHEVAEMIENEHLSDDVAISIVNNDDCITISGINECIERIIQVSMKAGALKASKLNTPIAFHSRLAIEGIEDLETALETITFKDTEIPILSVYNQQLLFSGLKLREEIIKNMYSKMDWKDMLQTTGAKVNTFIDVSTDASLTKLSRLVLDEHEFITLRKLNRLNKVKIGKGESGVGTN